MMQKTLDIPCYLNYRTADYHDAVIGVTQPTTKEPFITGNEGRGFQAVEVAEDFL